MRFQRLGTIAVALLLAGCGATEPPRPVFEEDAPENQFGFYEAQEQGDYNPFDDSADAARRAADSAADNVRSAAADDSGEAQRPVAQQIAYSYNYGFRADADAVAPLQQRHVALCESLGTNRCRVLSLARSGNDDYGYGRLELQVAAAEAREFGERLSSATEGVSAEMVSFGISGEDLTDDLIDTEARVEARTLLRDRLMEVLRTRQGDVGELVAAERGVAEVNEEIDAARSRLANLRNRVAMSEVSIEYDPFFGETRIGFSRPITQAIGSIGTTLGVTISVLIYLTVALVPVTVFLLLLRWLLHRAGFRIRWWKRDRAAEASAE